MPTDEEITAYFLTHHGVKGMHWGVRNARSVAEEGVGRETQEHRDYRKAALRQFNKENTPALERRINKKYGSGLTPEEYARLSTKDVTYRTGKTFNRITKDAEADKAKSALFVSSNKADATTYRGVLPWEEARLKSLFKSGNTRYDGYQEATYKATKKLVGPSEKERVDAFIRLMDSPSVRLPNGKMITGREYLKRVGYGHDARRLDSQRLGLKYYNQFLSTSYAKKSINDAYFESLRAKGYSVVADDNDRGVLTREPLIILNPNGSVKQMSVQRVSTDDVLNALSKYKDPVTN